MPSYAYAAIFLMTLLTAVFSSAMFTAQMQFFCQLSDPTMGGTYMTLLNTISNLGGTWPGSLSLKLVGFIETCTNDTSNGDPCVKAMDGYYPVAFLCALLGIGWYLTLGPKFLALKEHKSQSWHSTSSSATVSPKVYGVVGTLIAVFLLYQIM